MRKRLLCLLLSVCLSFSLFLTCVNASNIVDSGKCGENATWTLDDNGVLTISGKGKTASYYNEGPVDDGFSPFYENTNIKSVVVESGITEIGEYTFHSCYNLTDVSLPDTLSVIDDCAFYGCKSITSLDIPDSVTEIGWFAFKKCSSLGKIDVPESVRVIGRGAFQDCTGLSSVSILGSDVYVAYESFSGCTGLTTLKTACGVSEKSFEGCTSLREATIDGYVGVSAFSGCTSLTRLIAGGNIEANACLNCAALEYVNMKVGGVIYSYAFGGCTSLKRIDLPHYLTSVEANAFRDANALSDVYYNGTQDEWDKIEIQKTGNDPLFSAAIHVHDEQPSDTYENPFADVKDGAYYYDPVLWAVNHRPCQITNGTGKNTFSPDANCTRAQIVTFIWRANDCPQPLTTNNPFTDVREDSYYYNAVLWAVENGITNGTGNNTFSPDATVTRAQTVTFLWRMEGSKKLTASNPFVDVSAGEYYSDAVLWAVKNNITNGTSKNTFSPSSPCTRAQIVTFLFRT